MEDSSVYMYVLAGLLTILVYRWRVANLHGIPAVGSSLPLLSYLGAYRFLHHPKDMLQEGYEKYKGGVFKVARFDRWLVAVTGPKLVEELRRLPDDQVSQSEAVDDFFQLHYSFGHEVTADPIHIEIVRTQLTRHVAGAFNDIHEEISDSFSELIPASDEWAPFPASPIMQKIVARVSNRVFVGLPMCRNEGYIRLAIMHTLTVVKTSALMLWFPEALRPFVSVFVSETKRGIEAGRSFLEPMIQERLDKLNELGDSWADKPDDLLQWIMETAISKGKGIDEVIRYILLNNFAAIHTSSGSFTHALYTLAANPEYIQPLREEVDTVIREEGWTKSAMQRLKKVDSFLRESQRMNGVSGLSLRRMSLKDVTLSNGTYIPAGTIIVVPAVATHMDSENYTNPEVFNPWRFVDKRSEGLFVNTSADYLSFGYGKHACPGRFFAANMLKAMFAHMVLNYDMKFENEGHRPSNVWLGITVAPNPAAKVLFRKRRE